MADPPALSTPRGPYRDKPGYHDDPSDEDDAGHSLPHPDQVRTDAAVLVASGGASSVSGKSRGGMSRSQKRLALIFVGVLAATMLISFVAAVVAKNKDEGRSNSASANESSGKKTPPSGGVRDPDLDHSPYERDVVAYLSKYSPQSALETLGTPQNYAARWMAVQAANNGWDVPASHEPDDAYEFVERYVLAVVFYATGGGSESDGGWNDDYGFLSDEDTCDWHVSKEETIVGTHTQTEVLGARCNDDGAVNYLFLANNGLTGRLPDELGLLVSMEHFSVIANALTGPLPEVLSAWTDVLLFAVEQNQLNGPIPSYLGAYTKLEYLAMGFNQFYGSLPDFSGVTNLRQVSLQNNGLTGSVETFSACKSLTVLYLQSNSFNGVIQETTFKDLELRVLDLSNNQFSGMMPPHFWDYQIVNLHTNKLTGPLPEILYEDYGVEFFSVHNNDMGGPLPTNLDDLGSLTHLDLSDNGFQGPLPVDVFVLEDLVYLYLEGNNFDAGNFPSLTQVSALQELSLRSCNLNGALPNDIPDWYPDLIFLDLSNNQLQDSIPPQLGNVEDLRFLKLDRNKFSGVVPDHLTRLEDLTLLTLDHNDVTESIGKVCNDDGPEGLDYVVADCEIECPCCNFCCNEGDDDCNNGDLSPNLVSGYHRRQYRFSDELVWDSY